MFLSLQFGRWYHDPKILEDIVLNNKIFNSKISLSLLVYIAPTVRKLCVLINPNSSSYLLELLFEDVSFSLLLFSIFSTKNSPIATFRAIRLCLDQNSLDMDQQSNRTRALEKGLFKSLFLSPILKNLQLN